MKRSYASKNFRADALSIIRRANTIIEDYAAQGFDLTLRQVYYQFVARGWIPNRDSEYKRLGAVIADGRMAGLIDWDGIVDRTRNLRSLAHWNDASDLIDTAARQFRLARWDDQPNGVEVWIEKDALVGVIAGVCNELDVPFFSCRGYTSASEMHSAAVRIGDQVRAGRNMTILHLGDHDPSGIDMTRDIEDRLRLFIEVDTLWEGVAAGDVDQDDRTTFRPYLEAKVDPFFRVDRIALNADQVREYDPPPNPAKITDSRAAGYIAEFGRESWELDALDPATLTALVRDQVGALRDDDLWEDATDRQEDARRILTAVRDRWDDVAAFLGEA